MAKVRKSDRLHLRISAEVAREIRQHARSQSKTEVCGVLVDARIVGWYHSHPGFGVFLSDHDTFIHNNFFSSPQQVAWVYDPHSDEEGCFGWDGDRLKRLPRIDVVDSRGGELAGGSDRPAHKSTGADDSDEVEAPRKQISQARKHFEDPDESEDTEISRLTNTIFAVFSYLIVFVLGALLVWYLYPRPVYVIVDPYTGQPVAILKELPPEKSATPDSAPAKQAQPNPANPQRDDAHK
jgi:hypothetical protein